MEHADGPVDSPAGKRKLVASSASYEQALAKRMSQPRCARIWRHAKSRRRAKYYSRCRPGLASFKHWIILRMSPLLKAKGLMLVFAKRSL